MGIFLKPSLFSSKAFRFGACLTHRPEDSRANLQESQVRQVLHRSAVLGKTNQLEVHDQERTIHVGSVDELAQTIARWSHENVDPAIGSRCLQVFEANSSSGNRVDWHKFSAPGREDQFIFRVMPPMRDSIDCPFPTEIHADILEYLPPPEARLIQKGLAEPAYGSFDLRIHFFHDPRGLLSKDFSDKELADFFLVRGALFPLRKLLDQMSLKKEVRFFLDLTEVFNSLEASFGRMREVALAQWVKKEAQAGESLFLNQRGFSRTTLHPADLNRAVELAIAPTIWDHGDHEGLAFAGPQRKPSIPEAFLSEAKLEMAPPEFPNCITVDCTKRIPSSVAIDLHFWPQGGGVFTGSTRDAAFYRALAKVTGDLRNFAEGNPRED